MAVVRKKQDDKNLQILRELVTTGNGNRQCFDCGQKGPTYVNMTIGSFVCTRCSGVLRGLTPPHRVKSISMATFTPDEIDFLKAHGNDDCAKTWLGLWDPKRIVHQEQRELMIDKYERKRYYLEPGSPLKSLANATKLSNGNVNGNSVLSNNIYNNNMSNLNSHHLFNNNKHSLNGNGSSINGNGFHKPTDDSFVTPAINGTSTFVNRPVAVNKNQIADSNNGFSSDFDFVADFNSATIFDSTSNGTSLTNGYGKIQQNGGNRAKNEGSENFADFEHAPIYNAAGSLSNSSTSNSVSSSATINSNSSLSSAPSIDRYAALKDLDEQLRESKAAAHFVTTAVDAFNNEPIVPSNANPFKAATQPQLPSQGQQIANPFQAPSAASIFNTGAPSMFPTATARTTATQQMQSNTTNGFVGFNNGFGLASPQNGVGVTVPNGCGFGFGAVQQQITTGGNFNNPFATSNNPFL